MTQLQEKYVSVNEQRIYYLEGGTRSTTPILLIPGWAVGIKPYQETLLRLSQQHWVIGPELPGFGKSSPLETSWNYRDYGECFVAFLEQLKIQNVHLIGHSLGGGIAVTIAASRPELVRSLVLVGSTGIPVDPLPVVLLHRAVEIFAEVPHMKFPQLGQIAEAFLVNACFRTQTTIQTLFLALEENLKPLLPAIKAPCLLVWGAKDLTTPLRAGEAFACLIKNSQLVVMDGYHEWSLFFVDSFTRIVFDFLKTEAVQ